MLHNSLSTENRGNVDNGAEHREINPKRKCRPFETCKNGGTKGGVAGRIAERGVKKRWQRSRSPNTCGRIPASKSAGCPARKRVKETERKQKKTKRQA